MRTTRIIAEAVTAALLLVSGCSAGDGTAEGSDAGSDKSELTTSDDSAALGEPVEGLQGAPIPSAAGVADDDVPTAATEGVVYSVPDGSALAAWYEEHAPSGANIGDWVYCEDGPLLDPGDAGRIYTKPSQTGLPGDEDVLEITANVEGTITVLFTIDGFPC